VPEPLAYLNGRLVPAAEARLAVSDAGVVLGATVAEQTRTFRHRPWRLDDHLDRLFRSLRYTRIDPGLSRDDLAAVSHELLAHNARLIDDADDLGLVHFVTAGEYPTYAGGPARQGPTVCAHTFPLPFELWAKKMREGARLVTPSVRQVPPQCWDPQIKCRSRMHYFLADQEARLVDPEASALLLDLNGNVTETSAANVLIVERGAVVSPPAAGTLAGVSRSTVIGLCAKLGLPFAERDLRVYNVLNADEALLTSTPYCVMPVTRVNGVPIGDGRPGPVFRRLLGAWGEELGLDIDRQIQERAKRRPAGPAPAPKDEEATAAHETPR
jgi:branched-subunit amino acid aminotransferase/4-amino-4-deoxychorismate lyase